MDLHIALKSGYNPKAYVIQGLQPCKSLLFYNTSEGVIEVRLLLWIRIPIVPSTSTRADHERMLRE